MFGRRGFWPRKSMVAYDPEHPSDVPPGPWRRFGDRVLRRPGMALIVTGVVFCIGALGLLAYKVDYSTHELLQASVESVSGFEVLRQAFPAGTLAPTTILVQSDSGPVTPARRRGGARRS